MDYLFAPSESRARDFLSRNTVRQDAKVRLPHQRMHGERYTENDVLYILDGCPNTMLATIQINSMTSPSKPQVISVEER